LTGRRPPALLTVLLAPAVVLGLLPARTLAFELIDQPPAYRRVLNLNLGDTPFETLGYGLKSWNRLAAEALNAWNEVGIGTLPDHNFFSVGAPGPPGNPCRRDGINEVRFASTLCGSSWGGLLGVTIAWIIDGRIVETDVILDSSRAIDAYPGPLLQPRDFYRVLLHELGHAAGLDHPDGAGQTVTALMNGSISDVDGIQADDRAGARAVQWDPGRIGRIENFVRSLYAAVLGRTASAAEVNSWASVVVSSPPDSASPLLLVNAFLLGGESMDLPRTLEEHVRLLYRALFGRTPSVEEIATWVGILLERFNRLIPAFVGSEEFQGYRARTAPATILERFYREALGRSASAVEVSAWVAAVTATGDWGAVARAFLNSAEYLAVPRTLAQHVAVLYRAVLGRAPSAAESASWVTLLTAELARSHEAFVNSGEFRDRAQFLFQ
jgi:hypothetical protein